MDNDAFLRQYNEYCQAYPDPEIDYGVPISWAIEKAMRPERWGNTTGLFSAIDKVDGVLTERVFAAKFCRGVLHRQEVLGVLECGLILCKNCYQRWGMMQGFYVYGFTGKDGPYMDYYHTERFPFMTLFDYSSIDTARVWRRCLTSAQYLAGLDAGLRYSGFCEIPGIHAMDFIRLFRQFPIAEMIGKLKLPSLCTEKALPVIGKNRSLQKFIFRHADSIRQHRVSLYHIEKAFKKNVDPGEYVARISEKIRASKTLRFISLAAKEKLLEHASCEKVVAYIYRQHISVPLYEDYIKACDWLRLDFSDTKVLFPHDFMAMHDAYTSQFFAYTHQDRKLREIDERRKCAAAMRRAAENFSFVAWRHGLFLMVVATTKEDLIAEGAALHHCVGRMDYDERQARGDSLICFMRRADAPDVPYVTVELGLSSRPYWIRQSYGDHDRLPDAEAIMWLKSWIRHVRTATTKRERRIQDGSWPNDDKKRGYAAVS